MGKPLSRDLESVKTFWRDKLEKGSAKEQMRAAQHLERIALEELKHRRSAKIQKAKQAEIEASAYDPTRDPEPEHSKEDRMFCVENCPHLVWEKRQKEWKAAHPELQPAVIDPYSHA